MSSDSDPILESLEQALRGFLLTKRRHPLLVAVFEEGERLEKLEIRRKGRSLAFDHPVLQLVRDCFDMLVIDLYSLRESMVETDGLLNLLRAQPDRLRLAQASEFPPRPVMVTDLAGEGERWRERVRAEMDLSFRERIAASVNGSLEWLLPGAPPVSSEGIDALIKRFRKDTKATEDDRNRFRAHRFETADVRFFQSLPQLEQQLGVFQQYLAALHHVLTRNSMSFDLQWATSAPGPVARDLADMMVLGSVNRACNQYGVPPKPSEDNPRPWYWSARNQYFALGMTACALRGVLERIVGVLARRAGR
jgi:hypothetical protein